MVRCPFEPDPGHAGEGTGMFQNSASSDAAHHIQDASTQDARRRVTVVGAGVAGAWQALSFAKAGYSVKLFERDDAAMPHATSHFAGGMLAPWCEQETSEPVIPASVPARSICGAPRCPLRPSTVHWWWR